MKGVLINPRIKKVRGWNRRIRALHQWQQNNEKPQIEPPHNYDFVKITLDPWYGFPPRNPPGWFQKRVLESMLELYTLWHQELQKQEAPFYLKIWLYDQRFIQSQIVAAQNDAIEKYETLFHTPKQEEKFPLERFFMNRDLVDRFNWVCADDEEPVLEKTDADIFSPAEMDRIRQNAHRTEYAKFSDENIYYIKYGDIWIGQTKPV